MEVRNSIVLQDSMSPVLDKILTSLRHTLDLLKSTTGGSAMFNQAKKDILEAQKALNEYNASLKNAQQPPTPPPPRTPNFSGVWSQFKMPFTETLAGIELTKRGLQSIKEVANFGDEMILNQARIKIMNDGLMSTEEIQERIFQAAQRSRAEYIATANTVTRIGILAGQAFRFTEGENVGKLNVEELIKFNELVNKAFVVGGSTAVEQKSAMYQLTQALASGRLQGDELRTIREAAPLLRNAIRDYMGVSEDKFKKMARDGEITSEIIKNAVFNSAKDIEDAFETMPLTAEQSLVKLQNVFQMITRNMFMGFSSTLASIIQTLTNNISTVVFVLGYLTSIAVVTQLKTLASLLLRVATAAWAMASGFIAANLPIILVITAVFALLGILLKFPPALGLIVSAFYTFGSVVYDIFVGLTNIVIGFINLIIKGINKINELRGVSARIEEHKYGELINPFDAAKKGFDVGKDISLNASDSLTRMFDPIRNTFLSTNAGITTGGSNLLSGGDVDVNTVKNVKGGKISLDEDSIKYLNQEGAIDFVNRYTTMRPVLRVNFGDVHETADVEQIADKLITMMQDAYSTSLE